MPGAGFRRCDSCDASIDSSQVIKSAWQSFGALDICNHCFSPEHKPIWIVLGNLIDQVAFLESRKGN